MTPPRRLSRWITLAVLCTLVVAALMLTRWRQADPPPESGARAGGDALLPQALAATLDRSLQRDGTRQAAALAIRPLRGATDDRDTQALADWLCDTIAAQLARLERLRVTDCASARVALASQLDDAQLARLLAVDHLLRGRLERLGDERVHVRIEMVRAGAGEPLWAIDAEYDAATLQQLPAQVARRTSEALGQSPAGTDVVPIPARAYARYLLAVRRAAQGAIDDLRAALGLVDEALAEAPDYAPAVLLRLNLLDHLGDSPAGTSPTTTAEHRAAQAQRMAGMEALAQRLLAADPADPRGHRLLAAVTSNQRRWVDTFRHVDAALAQPALDAATLRSMTTGHAAAGYVGRARELALEAARLDPLSASSHLNLASLHGLLGDHARMLDSARVAEALGAPQAKTFDAMVALREGRLVEAEALYRAASEAARVDGRWVQPLFRGLADPARREEAAAALDAMPAELRFAMNNFYLQYAALGDVERAVRTTRNNLDYPPGDWMRQWWSPEFAVVRRDPRFAELADKAGLLALWRVRGAPDLCRFDERGALQCR
jgi:TolB-like protein